MARGVQSVSLFRSDEDYEVFLKILQKTKEKYPFLIHSYCLMTTHFHLLVTTKTDAIWKIMARIMQNYAMYFNRKYKKKGHLFDSRYASGLVEDLRYFLEASRYIHLNPVRANMVGEPLDYKYSSYRDIVIGEEQDEFLDYEELLSYFGENPRENYRRYVESVIDIKKELNKPLES